MQLTTPTLLTIFRIAAVPAIVSVYLLDFKYGHWYCAILFALAGLSDFLDGYLARKWQQESKLGEFLDPVADKLLVVILLLLVASDPKVDKLLVAPLLAKISIMVIVAREIIVSALREWMAEIGKREVVAVSGLGKWKTTAQMVAMGAFLFQKPLLFLPTMLIGETLIHVAAVLTIWSMMTYVKAASKATVTASK